MILENGKELILAYVKENGGATRGKNVYVAVALEPIELQDAMEIQSNLGYNPRGYDFYNYTFKCITKDQSFFASWESGGSCD